MSLEEAASRDQDAVKRAGGWVGSRCREGADEDMGVGLSAKDPCRFRTSQPPPC